MQRFSRFLDDHVLTFMAGFLLLFIPLYPKLPLFEIIPGYIVRVRLEDVFILLTILAYIIQVVRHKATFWLTPLTKPILLYTGIGFLSVLSALFITQTVPFSSIHVQKLFLHFFRRLEYFSLFFIFFASIRSLRQVKIYFLLFFLAVLGVTIYGYGQKYLYWCAFSTMNREFSKGWCLYLTEHARVISTFGGHYDLAAFTMLSLAFLWSLVFGLRERLSKIIASILLGGSFWLIILTASRVSFISYLVALSLVVFLWMFQRGIGWGVSRWFASIGLSLLIMLSFGDLSERFQRIFRLNERFRGIRALLLKPAILPPTDVLPLTEADQLAWVTSKSDQPPSFVKPGTPGLAEKPADVSEEVPEWVESEVLPDGSIREIPKKRVYSQTALRFDLSTSIRLDALWPRAFQGFLRNPLLGSGYSTLTKARITDFTEAESTDNGYFRALGETGILGSISYYAIIFTILLIFLNALGGIKDPVFYALVSGGVGGIIGLLVNNSYIDIFEASKIALPFWALSGTLLAGIEVEKKSIEQNRRRLRLQIDWSAIRKNLQAIFVNPLFALLLIVILAFALRTHKLNAPLADWHSWRQADTSAVTRNFDRFGINVLYPTYDDLSSVASGMPNPRGLRLVEFPIYNVVSVWLKKLIPEFTTEVAGRMTSILASLGSLIFIYFIVKEHLGTRLALLSAAVFATLPYNIYYSRVVLPEPALVFTSLGMIYYFLRLLRDHEENVAIRPRLLTVLTHFGLVLIFASLSLLIKPYSAFLYLPLIYLALSRFSWRLIQRPLIISLFLLPWIPFILWRMWIAQFPEGIPAYMWLLNGDSIRLKGAFFFWIFADRLGRLILGYWGLIPLGIGLLYPHRGKYRWFYHVWLVAIILYLVTFATGNVRHDYYQILMVPIVSIFVSIGIDKLVFGVSQDFQPLIARLLAVTSYVFLVMFGWYHIRDFFNINHPEIVTAGLAVKDLTHWKAKVIAPYDGDTAFLYQTERFGWPVMDASLEQMISKGAHYYVSVRDDALTKEIVKFAKNPDTLHPFKIIKEEKEYVIVQIVPNDKLPKD